MATNDNDNTDISSATISDSIITNDDFQLVQSNINAKDVVFQNHTLYWDANTDTPCEHGITQSLESVISGLEARIKRLESALADYIILEEEPKDE